MQSEKQKAQILLNHPVFAEIHELGNTILDLEHALKSRNTETISIRLIEALHKIENAGFKPTRRGEDHDYTLALKVLLEYRWAAGLIHMESKLQACANGAPSARSVETMDNVLRALCCEMEIYRNQE
jgi:hypothetical protein